MKHIVKPKGEAMTNTPAPVAPDLVNLLRKAKPDEHCNDSLCAESAATITALRAEVERLTAVNALMEYAAFPSAEDAKDAETWIAANPGRPLSDYCPPGGLLVKRLTAEVERLVKSRNKWGQKYNKALAHQKELYAQLTEQAAEIEKLRNDVRLAVMSDSKECTAISEVNARLTAEVERWKHAFAVQSRKLQSVLHIPEARAALKEKTASDYGISLENPAIALTQEPRT
jgi:hypothetical protein